MSKSATTTDDLFDVVQEMPPLHPGEMLREEFMEPLGLTAYGLAKALHVPRTRIERIVREETLISVDTALRLGRYFGTGPEHWLHFNHLYEKDLARRADTSHLGMISPSPHLAAAE
ncbi:MAG: HigA family addiction module antitoxin [Beijerinckiaceae bacterium]